MGDNDIVVKLEDVRVESLKEARERARKVRRNAPEREVLSDRTTDIDEIIDALQEAKSAGIETVYVNDDGQTRPPKARKTNNLREYTATTTEPRTLSEWVEL